PHHLGRCAARRRRPPEQSRRPRGDGDSRHRAPARAGPPAPRPHAPACAPARPLAGHLRRHRCAPRRTPRGHGDARSDRGRGARRAARGGLRIAHLPGGRPGTGSRTTGDGAGVSSARHRPARAARLGRAPGDGPTRAGGGRAPCVAPQGNRGSADRPRRARAWRDGTPARPPRTLPLDRRGRDHPGARVTTPPAAGWLSAALERRFALAAAGTTVEREVLAGLTTFLTMSYILLVNPVILGAAGMDRGAVLVATSLTAA